jgi:flagellar biosynthesis protein FliR
MIDHEIQDLLASIMRLAQSINFGWTFLLLLIRYTGLFIFIPGIGGGIDGATKKFMGILVLSLLSALNTKPTEIPADLGLIVAQLVSELLMGAFVGFLPAMVIAAVHVAGQLASISMGLGAAQMIDPNSGVNTSQVGQLWADAVIMVFLTIGGLEQVILAVADTKVGIPPGQFVVNANTIDILISQWSRLFEFATLISAPVIVSLLLAQLLISKVISQLNIFIISYPLTIGLGLFISTLLIPEIAKVGAKELAIVVEILT